MSAPVLLLIIVGVIVLLYGLHRAASWAERRGWIYYRTKGKSGGLGMSLIGQIYQPSIEHVVDEQQAERIRADRTESGDKPNEIVLDGDEG